MACKPFRKDHFLASLFPVDLGGSTLQLGSCFTLFGGFLGFFLNFLGVPLLVVGRGGTAKHGWVPMVFFCVFVWGGEVEETHMSEETADESQKTSR